MGGVNVGDPVPIFHEEFAGASSKSLAIVVLEIFASETDGGRTLVAYSSKLNSWIESRTVQYTVQCSRGWVIIINRVKLAGRQK